MEKEHLGILLEDIRGKFELVLEGHAALRAEIHEFRSESNEKHEQTAFLLKDMSTKVDAVAADLLAHCAGTEAHLSYKVRDNTHAAGQYVARGTSRRPVPLHFFTPPAPPVRIL